MMDGEEELLGLVFALLPVPDLLSSVALVSRAWHRVTLQPLLWHRFCVRDQVWTEAAPQPEYWMLYYKGISGCWCERSIHQLLYFSLHCIEHSVAWHFSPDPKLMCTSISLISKPL